MPFNYNANLVIEQRKTTIPCKSDKNKNWTSKSLAKSAAGKLRLDIWFAV